MNTFKLPFFISSILTTVYWAGVTHSAGPRYFEGEIVKSQKDPRSYKGLYLANNMKVLLVQQPNATSSIVALSVGVGTFDDPKKMPGLINLLGATLLLGSREHPSPLLGGGNWVKSITAKSWQTHIAQIGASGPTFHSLLRKFASYFIDPLLDEASPTALESVISSQDDLLLHNINKNMLKIILIEKSLANKRHPLFYLSPENEEIVYRYPGPIYNKTILLEHPELKEVIHAELRAAFSKWYSANNMTLVVMGSDPLDVMEKEISDIFGNIVDKPVQKQDYDSEFFLNNIGRLGLKIYIDINNEEVPNILRITFPTPDVSAQYKTAPDKYVSFLLEHEEGLISTLKKKGLCEFLRTGYDYGGGLGFYNITLGLSGNTGLDKIDDIIELTFQYIRLIRTGGIQEKIFRLIQDRDYNAFNSSDVPYQPVPYVGSLAADLLEYPFEDILSFRFLHSEWDEFMIEIFLDYLRPDKMNATVVGNKLLHPTSEGIQTEPWFGTNYKFEDIEISKIKTWKEEVKLDDELRLPSFDQSGIPQN